MGKRPFPEEFLGGGHHRKLPSFLKALASDHGRMAQGFSSRNRIHSRSAQAAQGRAHVPRSLMARDAALRLPVRLPRFRLRAAARSRFSRRRRFRRSRRQSFGRRLRFPLGGTFASRVFSRRFQRLPGARPWYTYVGVAQSTPRTLCLSGDLPGVDPAMGNNYAHYGVAQASILPFLDLMRILFMRDYHGPPGTVGPPAVPGNESRQMAYRFAVPNDDARRIYAGIRFKWERTFTCRLPSMYWDQNGDPAYAEPFGVWFFIMIPRKQVNYPSGSAATAQAVGATTDYTLAMRPGIDYDYLTSDLFGNTAPFQEEAATMRAPLINKTRWKVVKKKFFRYGIGADAVRSFKFRWDFNGAVDNGRAPIFENATEFNNRRVPRLVIFNSSRIVSPIVTCFDKFYVKSADSLITVGALINTCNTACPDWPASSVTEWNSGARALTYLTPNLGNPTCE